MNNLPIWAGMWSAATYANSGTEMTTFESTVIWIIISAISIATIVIVTMVFKDDIIRYLKHKNEKVKLANWLKEQPKIEEDFEDSFRDFSDMFQEADSRRIHKISTGDTITSIAKEYETSVEDLMSLNLIRRPRDFAVGNVLIIPEEDVE